MLALAIDLFQFQYGTIKRCYKDDVSGSQKMFQFQYGTIKSMMIRLTNQRYLKFQFQYGTIKRQEEKGLKKVSRLVSIPIWYD